MIVRITILLLIATVCSAQLPDKKETPEIQVRFFLNNNSSFPDSAYQNFDWKNFEKLPAMHQKIDLRAVDWSLLNAAVLFFSNQYRIEKGKNELLFSNALRDASVFHSIEMLNRNFFNHINSSNRKMQTPYDRAKHFGFEQEFTGENINEEYIAFSEKDFLASLSYLELGKIIVKRWIDSPPHRKNLLNKDYKYLGCGTVWNLDAAKKTKLLKVMATQVFGG